MNVYALILFTILAAAGVVLWRRRRWLQATGCEAAALLPGWVLWTSLSWPALVLMAGVAGLVGWQRWSTTSGVVSRWSERSRRKAGVASSLDIARRGGAVAMRRTATKVRPSLAHCSSRARWCGPVSDVAVELCRVGPQRVWSSVEDVTLVFGGPRTGKTGWLAGRVLDAPGAAVVTSTRTDLLELCGPIRAVSRGPVWVFNPVGLGGIASSVTFDPLTGCSDPVTAGERATDMIAAASRGGSGDAERWDAQARRVLAALLHAAALGDQPMSVVLAWVADNDRAARDVPGLLRRSAVEAFERDATQFITTNERTRTSITNSIMPALGWLNHPAAAAAAAPGAGFDVAALLADRATVFLLGAEEAQTGPLVCALTGHIAREARRLAATNYGGRLDPPLELALDEAALISPVPLESWTADMGGRGVTIIAAFQSRAQLLARYGEHKTATILNNTGSVVLFGGTRDRDDLGFWSNLAGERDEGITTTDTHGRVASRSVRKVPVFSPGRIANLPPGRVLVFRRGLDPILGTARMAWRRRDVRAHTAGYPARAGARGLAGHLSFTACRATSATRTAVAVGCRVGQSCRRCWNAGATTAQRVRFAATRLRGRLHRAGTRAGSGAEEFFAAARDPHTRSQGQEPARPLRVLSHRVDHTLEPAESTVESAESAGPAGADVVDPPTGPIDLTAITHAVTHAVTGDGSDLHATGRWTS